MIPFTLNGQIALITGGATGLGLGMARCMKTAGARIVLLGRREDALKNAVAELGDCATCVVHDVTNFAHTDSAIKAAEQNAGGPIDILINNAGIHLKKNAIETTETDFLNILNTHVIAAHSLTRAVLPGMIQRKRGSILFTASMASLFGIPQVIAYSAAKSALVGMVHSLATEVSEHGVRVNAIAPGWIESDMMNKALSGDPVRRNKILERTPMKRFGNVEDVGWAATYLSSPAAKFITGVVLPVDGGMSVGF